MLAYQIVDFDNPISVEYMKISQESFAPAIKNGTLSEIRAVQCVTPKTLHEHEHQYEFRPSVIGIDGGWGNKKEQSPTEKSLKCSHFALIKKQSQTEEPFLILEHDAYLLPKHIKVFKHLCKIIEDNEVCYFNIGLFTACYGFSQRFAFWSYDMLVRQRFWINGGSYNTMERLFRTYTQEHLKKKDYYGIDPTVIHPWHACDTLGFGRWSQQYYDNYDPDRKNSIPTPVTQVVKKSLSVTLDHENYPQKFKDFPWTRHHYFHVID